MVIPSAITLDLLLLFLAGGALTFPGVALWKPKKQPDLFGQVAYLRAIAVTGTAVMLLGFTVHIALYQTIWMDSEVGVHIVSWLWRHGKPLYHGPEAPEYYSLLYGPLTYITYAAGFAVFGENLLAPKLVGAIFFILATWIVVARLLSMQLPAHKLWLVVAIAATAALPFGSFLYYPKADPILVYLAAFPFVFERPRHGLIASAGVAALTILLKVTGPLYLLPAICLLCYRVSRREVVVGAWGGLAVFTGIIVSAYFVIGEPTLNLYRYWLMDAEKGHPFVGAQFFLSLRYLAIPAAALALLAAVIPADERKRLLPSYFGLGIAALVLSFAGARLGAGTYHLAPLLPVFAILLAVTARHASISSRGSWQIPIFAAWAGVILLQALVMCTYVKNGVEHWRERRDAVADLVTVANMYPCSPREKGKRIEMGIFSKKCASVGMAYADTPEREVNYAIQLLFEGGYHVFNDIALWDMDIQGHRISADLTAAITRCPTRVWVVPKGAEPFSSRNFYNPSRPLFPQEFVKAFRDSYKLRKSRGRFDIWECAPKPEPV